MTRMLASVTGAEEAEIALQGGADIIDLKDPAQGALGAVAPEIVRGVVARVGGERPVSAVTGDLPMQPDQVLSAATAMVEAGAEIVKIGIFPGGAPEACLHALAPLAARAQLVGVMFADRAPDLSLLPLLAEAGFAGAMLDTADKGAGRLLDHMDLPRLRRFIASCRSHGLFAGLAGSLEAPDVPRLLVLRPEVLGFRGALCAPAGRTGRIDPKAVAAIRALIPEEAGQDRGDAWTQPSHGYPLDPQSEATRTDRVFLRDWVLPVRIGAYAHERAAPQRVRFAVEATVLRPAKPTRDMGDVFSYDIISDGIRMLTEGQHIVLAETLAERIAALVLAHPRVVKVSVCVEKLDVGTGVVGVRIERRRDDAVPPVELLFGSLSQ
jgi:dihydroneopterin aldolase